MPSKLLIAAVFSFLVALAWWAGSKSGDDSAAPGRLTAISTAAPHGAISPTPTMSGSAGLAASSPLKRLYNEGVGVVNLAALERYLAENHRSAKSLLAASRLNRNLTLLREAAQRFPNDPQVHFEMAMRSEDPQEKQSAIADLIRTDPKNAMGHYLAAAEAFDQGNAEEALRRLASAAEGGAIDAYNLPFLKADEEAYAAVGLAPVEAKGAAVYGRSIVYDEQLNRLLGQMLTLRESYDRNGEADASLALSEQGMVLARKCQQIPGQAANGELVGLTTEAKFLEKLDPATLVADENITVDVRRTRVAQRTDAIKQTLRGIDFNSPAVTPQLMAGYLDRLMASGELQATQWLRGQLGLQVPEIPK